MLDIVICAVIFGAFLTFYNSHKGEIDVKAKGLEDLIESQDKE